MRGSKHVAAIVPVSAEDLQLAPSLTDAQAERLWRQLEEERRKGTTVVYETANKAVAHLESGGTPAARRRVPGKLPKRARRE